MGKVAIKADVVSRLTAITGVKQVFPGRLKDGAYPSTGMPSFVVEIGPERITNQTYHASGAGKMHIAYDIHMLLILDRKDVAYGKAQTDALPFYDRVRAAFSNAPTLGGLCWSATLSESLNNLDIFREADVGQYPQVAWKLRVTEERAYSAVAS